jgi:hypothetical protein
MTEIMKLIGAFVRSVEGLVGGVPDDNGLIQALREPRAEFKKAIRRTAPDFRPLERPKDVKTAAAPPPLEFLSNEETERDCEPSDPHLAIFVEDVMKRANL